MLLQAQVEVNVKVNVPLLGQYLRTNAEQALQFDSQSAELRGAYPFVANLQYIQPLLPNRQLQNRSYPSALSDWYTLRLDDSKSATEWGQTLKQSGAFASVEQNRGINLHHFTQTEVDPPNDDSLALQWYHPFIQTFDAWDITKGSNNIKVGVIDTGLDWLHPEFDGQLALNSAEDRNGDGVFQAWPASEVRGGMFGDLDGIDDDGNGYVDDVIGYDFTDQIRSPFGGDYLSEDPIPLDDNMHGTFVAGIIAAKDNNQYGGTGLAPNCRLVTLRAFSASGIGEDDDIARAIIYAADNGIQILNFSFGDIYPSLMMHEAIQYAYSKDVIMVSSAGNGTGDNLHYPSGFNEVISVSASSVSLAEGREFLWQLSSYGVTVDLAAPGSGIYAPTLRDTSDTGEVTDFGAFSGTSAAAPMVTSAAALLLSHRGAMSPQQVRGILSSTADDISDTGWDHFTGGGRLNMLRALQAAGGSNVQIVSPLNDSGTSGDTVYILGTALHPEFEAYHLEWQAGIEGVGDWNPILLDQNRQRKEDTLGVWIISNLPEGEYTLRLRVDKTDGFSIEDRIRFIKDTSPPEIVLLQSGLIWDNEERKAFALFRDSDQGRHILHFRRIGQSTYQTLPYDRTTRNGEFLLGSSLLSNGQYECFISATNLAGLYAESAPFSLAFEADEVPLTGFNRLDATLPMGTYLNQTFDFDGDGLKEVVVGEYDENLSFGRIKFYEYNAGRFSMADSVGIKPILIPKDVADADEDGLLELLCSVNDSLYILEQASENAYPTVVNYTNFDQGYFAARFADTDRDGQLEFLAKNFEDYFVFERNGSSYEMAATLEDVSPDYFGSIAPRALVEDFDRDGTAEIVYGDFDGDVLIYEHANGNTYMNTWIDSTQLTKSGSYLLAGDFNGDGTTEMFVAAHASSLRNNDFEYDAPYWWLRIFRASANDTYEVIWEDFLYDIDTENYNAATAGNLDADTADEIVFTSFPRTYVIDYDGSDWGMKWFHYGAIATHHVIGDFNGNGINEFALGRGDTAFFFEQDFTYMGPDVVTTLKGRVLNQNTTELSWLPVANATEYLVWRGDYNPPNDLLISFIGATSTPQFTDTGLNPNASYLYVLQAVNPMLNPDTSDFGTFVVLTPHEACRLDSVVPQSNKQLTAYFSYPVEDRREDQALIRLNETHPPVSLIHTGTEGQRLVMGFTEPFIEGWNELTIDSSFQDRDEGLIDPNARSVMFWYEAKVEENLYLTHWETLNDKEAILYLNYPLTVSALDSSHYVLASVGNIVGIRWGNDEQTAVIVTIEKAAFGALGYPLSITLSDLTAQNGAQLADNEGNTATFSAFKQDLSEVFTYPNPVRPNAVFEGMRFANLTQEATMYVYTVSGRFVNRLEETDGDGGFEWDMRDESGKRIKPGIYVYRVTADGVDDFVGKFSVIE